VFIIFLARLSKNTRQGSLFPGASVHPRNESDREQPQAGSGWAWLRTSTSTIEKKKTSGKLGKGKIN
jgi:hypothetical protein